MTLPVSPRIDCHIHAVGRRSKPGASSISLKRCHVEGDFTLCNRDWQPEANRRTPLSTGDAT